MAIVVSGLCISAASLCLPSRAFYRAPLAVRLGSLFPFSQLSHLAASSHSPRSLPILRSLTRPGFRSRKSTKLHSPCSCRSATRRAFAPQKSQGCCLPAMSSASVSFQDRTHEFHSCVASLRKAAARRPLNGTAASLSRPASRNSTPGTARSSLDSSRTGAMPKSEFALAASQIGHGINECGAKLQKLAQRRIICPGCRAVR